MKHCFQCKGPFGLTRRNFASQQFCSNRCVDQYKFDVHGANELVKLIRKFRWARMEIEAKGIEAALGRGRATATDSVLASPHETD